MPRPLRHVAGYVRLVAVAMLLAVASSACAADFSEKKIQNLEATAADIGMAVAYYVKKNPDEATILDERELVLRATAKTPEKLKAYSDVSVRGRGKGDILVCTKDSQFLLFEDVACTPKIDLPYVKGSDWPCKFMLDAEALCATQ